VARLLCDHVAECPQSTLDDHVPKHLHRLALICLPWGTGGKDTNPVKMKSANGSISRTLTDEDGGVQEPASLDTEETITPRTLYEIFKAVLDSPHRKDAVHWPYKGHVTEQLGVIHEKCQRWPLSVDTQTSHLDTARQNKNGTLALGI
jgi:hypothetical protein